MRIRWKVMFPPVAAALAIVATGYSAEPTDSAIRYPAIHLVQATSPSDKVPKPAIAPKPDPAVEAAAPDCTACGVCASDKRGGSCCGRCDGLLGCSCDLGEPYSLFKNCWLTRCLGIKVGGWVQQGYTVNAEDPADGFNGPVALNDYHEQYQMNQAWLFLDKQAQTDGCGFALGGHIDMMYGTDWRFGVNSGLEDRITANDSPYGMVIPQAYVDLAYNDLTIRMGHYAGLLSYEQVPSVLNFFYSHSYTMGYGEPLLVTGVNANYKLSEQWAVDAGFHRGWMRWEDNNDTLDFMGGLTWTSSNKNTKLRFMVDAGPQDDAGVEDQFVYSLMWDQTFTKRLRYALQHVYGFTNDGDLFSNRDAEFYSLVNYLYYQINPCWAAGLRLEWFRDDDGSRVAGVGSVGRYGWASPPGFAGDFAALSVGLNWRPHANVVFRPEVRYDWYDGAPNEITGELPFDAGSKDDQLTVGADLIVTF